MKIEEIRFKNLNSLYGEWIIDLTAPEYQSNGIFAITGATGAGKSTILDAICLALYGSTPRLKTISSSTNEIMSRQTGDCFAEVTFKVNSGRYKCHWSQHRARKKPDGKLADSKHEITDAVSGDVLAVKKKDVANLVIEKTGMDLDRFTRSILLAQGGFSAFLKATADERSPILEQITGTEIYTTISKRVHDRQRSEREKYQLLVAESKGISYLSDDEELELSGNIERTTQEENKVSDKFRELSEQIQWKNRIHDLNRDIITITEDVKSSDKVKLEFESDRDILKLGIKAGELEGDFSSLSMLEKQQDMDSSQLESGKKELPSLEKVLSKNSATFTEVETILSKAKESFSVESEIIKKVRQMDFEIAQSRKNFTLEESVLMDFKSTLKLNNGKIEKLKDQIKILKDEFLSVGDYLTSNSLDINLNQDIGGIILQCKQIKTLRDDKYATEVKLENQKVILTNSDLDYKKTSKNLLEIRENHQLKTSELEAKKGGLEKLLNGKLQREYQADLNSFIMEKSLRVKIASLEEQRTALVDGDACPLCGSESHPYAIGNIPAIDETTSKIAQIEELLKAVNDSNSEIKLGEEGIVSLGVEITQAEKKLIISESEKGELEREIKRLNSELVKIVESLSSVEKPLLETLKRYNYSSLPTDRIDDLILDLKTRESLWRDNSSKQESFNDSSSKLELENNQLGNLIEADEKQLETISSKIVTLKEILNQSLKNRDELYGDKNPELEEQRLKLQITKNELDLESSRTLLDKSSKQLIEVKIRTESLGERVVKRAAEIEKLSRVFLASCLDVGFTDLEDFSASRVSKDRLKELTETASKIDKKSSELSIKLEDRKATLNRETKRDLTELDLDQLKKQYNTDSLKVRELGEVLGSLKQKLQNSLDAKAKIESSLKEIEGQKVEMENWLKLHALIGSADGKKFRNFAQGLTFEMMVNHANRELIKMSDRYLLIRDKDNPLELNVIDNYQAGEIRSTKNLSGGESFIISLALALGLSNMASSKVRVDSLFLDEGFGTLDEEALEVALDTLSTLHQDGKLIGIISHISGLKERISTRITVSKSAGGRGIISGPGCKELK